MGTQIKFGKSYLSSDTPGSSITGIANASNGMFIAVADSGEVYTKRLYFKDFNGNVNLIGEDLDNLSVGAQVYVGGMTDSSTGISIANTGSNDSNYAIGVYPSGETVDPTLYVDYSGSIGTSGNIAAEGKAIIGSDVSSTTKGVHIKSSSSDTTNNAFGIYNGSDNAALSIKYTGEIATSGGISAAGKVDIGSTSAGTKGVHIKSSSSDTTNNALGIYHVSDIATLSVKYTGDINTLGKIDVGSSTVGEKGVHIKGGSGDGGVVALGIYNNSNISTFSVKYNGDVNISGDITVSNSAKRVITPVVTSSIDINVSRFIINDSGVSLYNGSNRTFYANRTNGKVICGDIEGAIISGTTVKGTQLKIGNTYYTASFTNGVLSFTTA